MSLGLKIHSLTEFKSVKKHCDSDNARHSKSPDFIEEMEVIALKIARDLGIQEGSPILMSGGTPTGAGKTNFMRILTVNKVREIE